MAVQMLGIKTKFTDDQGRPLIGGSVHTYYAGTSLPQDTFSDPELTVPNTNPVKLDDTGSANIFLKGTYRVRVFDRKGKFVEEQDNVDQLATVAEVFKNKGGLNAANERIDALTSEVNSVKEKTLVVESIAGLSTIKNPKDGLRVYVKSYHAGLGKGGSYFAYDSSRVSENDSGSVINGWVREENGERYNVLYFGATGDGQGTKLSSVFSTLANAKTIYPFVESLDHTLDWAAFKSAINSYKCYKLYVPSGVYSLGKDSLHIPRDKGNFTIIGDGASGDSTTKLLSTPSKAGFIAIKAESYGFVLTDISLESTTGNSDGFEAIGVQHMADVAGSVGRVVHSGIRILNFSKSQMRVALAISYGFSNCTMQGGEHTLWIAPHPSNELNYVSTTVTLDQVYLTNGSKSCFYAYRIPSLLCNKLIIEGGAHEANEANNLAALTIDSCRNVQLNAGYFEANKRNYYFYGTSVVVIANEYGREVFNSIIKHNPSVLESQRGSTEILGNSIKTRQLKADDYKGVIEVVSPISFNKDIILGRLSVGYTSSTTAPSNSLSSIQLMYNHNNGVGRYGQSLDFGVTNSSAGSSSGWIRFAAKRLDNSNKSEVTVVSSTGNSFYTYEPSSDNPIASFSADRGMSIYPKSGVNPKNNGEILFELASDTQLIIKVKGSDGVIRKTELTLT